MYASLDELPVFSSLDRDQLSLLEPLLEFYSCRTGTTIIEQGLPAEFIYIVKNGRVEIFYKPYDAPAITVTHIMPNGVFGWSAAIGSAVYSSSANAIEPVEAFRLRGSDLRKLCIDHPETGRIILDRLANIVSSRWTHAKDQVKSLLARGMDDDKEKKPADK